MARGYERFLTKFTAQASAVIAADADSGGTTTDFDTTASGNLDGCDRANVEIDVTSAPTTEAQCIIYIQALEMDGVGYAAQKFAGSVTIATTADKYNVEIMVPYEKGKIVLHAVDYGFTASAEMKGKYLADA